MERVPVEHGEVGPHPDLDRARFVVVVHERRPAGERSEGSLQTDALCRKENRAVRRAGSSPRGCDLHLQERIRRRDRPVASEGHDRARPAEVADRVETLGPVADPRLGHRLDQRIGLRPERLHVRDGADFSEPPDVLWIRQLEMGDVVPQVVRSVRATRRLQRIQRASNRAIAERVLMHLEPQRIEPDDRLLQRLRVDELDPAAVLPTEGSLVGRQHRRGAGLRTAVQHDLDGRRVHVAGAPPHPPIHECVDLFHAAMSIPPEGRHDPSVELARVVQRPVGAEQIGLDPRVLPTGDPEGMQLGLRHTDRTPPVLGRGSRHDAGPEGVRRALLQTSRRHSAGVPDVVAVPGVGRRGGDPAGLECSRVDPCRVRVGVHQEDRPVRDDGIEVRGSRTVRRLEDRVVPTASHDPREIGMLACEGRDPLEVRVSRRQIIEVHVQEDPAGERRVDVRVLEPGHDAGAADDLVRGADAVAHLILGTDGDDPVTLDRDRPYPPPRRIDRVDVSDEDQVRIIHGRGRYHRS